MVVLGCTQAEKKGSIQGTITLEDATEYSGVLVSLKETGFAAPTQSTGFSTTPHRDGSYQILEVLKGSYKIIFGKDGLVPEE